VLKGLPRGRKGFILLRRFHRDRIIVLLKQLTDSKVANELFHTSYKNLFRKSLLKQ